MDNKNSNSIIDCACVIHGDGYDWCYVERLYNMLDRYLRREFRFHVYTETDRPVPAHMIKHELTPWHNISGPRRSWWYKLQLFDPKHMTGNILYFDLDVVIVRPVTWITELNTDHLWAVRDFRYLQGNRRKQLNSSIMWFNVDTFSYVWRHAAAGDINQISKNYRGDQDYIEDVVDANQLSLFPEDRVQSYRWECLDGGFDFQRRKYRSPGSGVAVVDATSVIVFHGNPKPHEVQDPVILKYWC
jgi:hypothetical protein